MPTEVAQTRLSTWSMVRVMATLVAVGFFVAFAVLKLSILVLSADLVLVWPNNNLTLHRASMTESGHLVTLTIDPEAPSYFYSYGFYVRGTRHHGTLRLCPPQGWELHLKQTTSTDVTQQVMCISIQDTGIPYSVSWNMSNTIATRLGKLCPMLYIGKSPMPEPETLCPPQATISASPSRELVQPDSPESTPEEKFEFAANSQTNTISGTNFFEEGLQFFRSDGAAWPIPMDADSDPQEEE